MRPPLYFCGLINQWNGVVAVERESIWLGWVKKSEKKGKFKVAEDFDDAWNGGRDQSP